MSNGAFLPLAVIGGGITGGVVVWLAVTFVCFITDSLDPRHSYDRPPNPPPGDGEPPRG